jgi:hypothetical protein
MDKEIQSSKNSLISFWEESPALFKIFSLISLFLAFSSITSLADTIFAWRGFIKEGVDFYRTVLFLPVREYLEGYGLYISQKEADFILLFGIHNGMVIRGFWLLTKPNESKIPAIIFTLGMVSASVYLVYESAISDHPSRLDWFNLFGFIVMILFPLQYVDKKQRILYFAPLVFIIMLVLVLAAINEGLTRPFTIQ